MASKNLHEDSDEHKGVVESDQYEGPSQGSFTGQLPHQTSNAMIKQSDSAFPEPNGEAEHSGEPEAAPPNAANVKRETQAAHSRLIALREKIGEHPELEEA